MTSSKYDKRCRLHGIIIYGDWMCIFCCIKTHYFYNEKTIKNIKEYKELETVRHAHGQLVFSKECGPARGKTDP